MSARLPATFIGTQSAATPRPPLATTPSRVTVRAMIRTAQLTFAPPSCRAAPLRARQP